MVHILFPDIPYIYIINILIPKITSITVNVANQMGNKHYLVMITGIHGQLSNTSGVWV